MPILAPLRVLLLGEDRYSKQFQKLVKKTARIGESIGAVGATLTRGLTVPMGLLGAVSMRSAVQLNEAMASVGTLIPGEAKHLENYKKQVMDLAKETGVSSTIIAEGLYETISAFGDLPDTMQKLTIATRMSKAGLSTVKEALALTSAVTKGYGQDSAEAVQKVSDLAFLTVKLGQTTFPELAASMGKVVPLAAALGVSQEELFGAMATLTGVTGTAAEAATQLRSILGSAAKPSEDLTKASKKLGYASGAAMISELGLEKTMKKVADITGKNVDQIGKLITRKEGLVATLALTGGQAKKFAEKTAAMGDAAGKTDEAYREQTEGINATGHALRQALQKFNNMAIVIGDKLLPVVVKLVDKITPLVDKFVALDDSTIELSLKIAGLVMAAGPLLLVLSKGISLTATLMALFGPGRGLGGVFTRLGGPMRTTTAGLAGMNAASTGLLGNLKASLRTAGRIKVPGFGAPVTAGGVVGAAAGAVGAGMLGWEIGSAIERNFFAPQNEQNHRMLQKAETFFEGSNARTEEELKQAAKNLDKLRSTIETQTAGTEEIAGQLMSWIGMAEAPAERYRRALENLNAEQKAIGQKQIQLLEKQLEATHEKYLPTEKETEKWAKDPMVMKYLNEIRERDKIPAEASITVQFEGLPKDAKAKVRRQKGVKVKSGKGNVMEGRV